MVLNVTLKPFTNATAVFTASLIGDPISPVAAGV
jgi:hypothetical protein